MRKITGEIKQNNIYIKNDINIIQPVIFNFGDEKYIIVFDGELYNSEELINELELSGYKFKEYSNDEIIFYSYLKWREKALVKFNGIFSFVIFEKNNKKLFCARDKTGVKPFFYYINEDLFIFSSEIKSFFENFNITPEINAQSVAEIILIGPGRTPGYGIFKNIFELEPGFYGVFENNKFNKYKYWDLTDGEHNENFEETAEKVRELAVDSIKRRINLNLNNKICVFLSGGLDSSIITSVAAKYFKEKNIKLNAFSVDYKNNEKYFNANKFQPDSDIKYIEHMKNYLNDKYGDIFEHHQIILETQNLVNALYSAVDARDFPGMADVDASLLLFCEEIKNYADIALSGESADEIFGGYPWYRNQNIKESFGFPWSQNIDFRKSFLKDDFINIIDAENYVGERYFKTISESDVSKTFDSNEKRIKQLVNLNIKWFMQNLLERQNKMSAHAELKIRAPYCDYRIFEYLYKIPWEYKNYNGFEKGLLRVAMRDYLPEEVLWRKKSPYPKTHNPEYLNIVSKILTEIINNNSSPLLNIIKKESLENLLKSEISTPWYGQLMTLPQTVAYFIQINYWLEKYKIKMT